MHTPLKTFLDGESESESALDYHSLASQLDSNLIKLEMVQHQSRQILQGQTQWREQDPLELEPPEMMK